MAALLHILEYTPLSSYWCLFYLIEEAYPTFTTSEVSVRSCLYGTAPQTDTLRFSAKLILGIMFLILLRGGVPRYRYDFLTKLGWVKFLTYVLAWFCVTFLMLVLS